MLVSEKQRVVVCPLHQPIFEGDVCFVVAASIFRAMELSEMEATEEELTALHEVDRKLHSMGIL